MEINAEPTNKNWELVIIKAIGIYSYHSAWKG
jgi:hypothetical protein